MNSRADILLMLSCFAAILAACEPVGDANIAAQGEHSSGVVPIEEVAFKPIEKGDVLLAFKRQKTHDILYVLNLLKASPLNFEALELVACAVDPCELADDNWNWDALNNALVRVNLIDVLLQADGNGLSILDAEKLLLEVLDGLDSKNPQVVQRSLLVLGFRDRKEYAPEIERVALATRNDTTFRVAIISLKWMSADNSGKAIARIRDSSNSHRQAILDEVTLGTQ